MNAEGQPNLSGNFVEQGSQGQVHVTSEGVTPVPANPQDLSFRGRDALTAAGKEPSLSKVPEGYMLADTTGEPDQTYAEAQMRHELNEVLAEHQPTEQTPTPNPLLPDNISGQPVEEKADSRPPVAMIDRIPDFHEQPKQEPPEIKR